MHRDIPAELRELVADHLVGGAPLADALFKIADALEQQAGWFTAALNALSERVEMCEAVQVLG